MNRNDNLYIILNKNKCIGCKLCEKACIKNHITEEDLTLAKEVDIEIPKVARLFFDETNPKDGPITCRHCENAPCLNSCKLGAISKINGSIILDEEKCVGCGLCVKACPFGAIQVHPKLKKKEKKLKKSAYKCDLCNGEDLACVKACPKDALKVINIDEEKYNKALKSASMFKIK